VTFVNIGSIYYIKYYIKYIKYHKNIIKIFHFQQNRLKSIRGPLRMVIGNQRSAEGLQISLEKKPTPSLPQTPTASLVEMTNRLISPDSSARAPTPATPISKVAPGIGIFA